jgi:hypothetical protein
MSLFHTKTAFITKKNKDCCNCNLDILLPSLVLVLISNTLNAHKTEAENNVFLVNQDSIIDKNTLIPLPLIYYKTETGLVYGGAALYNFYFERKKPINPSQIQPGVGYSTLNQLIAYTHFLLFWNQNRNFTFGDLEYYRFSYNFYGIGNNSHADKYTSYRAHIFRFWANSMVKIKPRTYIGGRFFFEKYDIGNKWHTRKDFDTSTLPAKFQQNNVSGAITNQTLGLGGSIIVDKRDNVYYPMKGYYAEFSLTLHSKNFASTHSFSTISNDLMYYKTIFKNTVVATNAYALLNFGEDVPFNRMARLGGHKKMRGLYEGFLTDKHGVAIQAEIRQVLFWRVGITAFANAGQVANNFTDFSLTGFRYTYGTGVRILFDKEKKVNLRIDYGISNLGMKGFYISFNEAF